MPSSNSSMTYPSENGSDVFHDEEFWSLPTAISSPALSDQSMVTNVSSEPDEQDYKILTEYPSETLQYKILKDYTEWYVETLYPKLLLVEAACRKMEEANGTLAEMTSRTGTTTASMDTALNHVAAVLVEQGMLLDIVEYPTAGGLVKWQIYLGEDSFIHGDAQSKWEVLSTAFFTERLSVLRKMGVCVCRFK